MRKLILFVSSLVSIPLFALQLHVSNYGARPNDGIDDTKAINDAIAQGNNNTIIFASGVYDLITPDPEPDRYLKISSLHNVTLQGAVTPDGKPDTKLLRHLTVEDMASPPRTAYVYDGSNITLKNFIIDNTPHLCTSGEITEKYTLSDGTQGIRVAIFPGLPMDADMPCYSANVWNPDTQDLKEGVESLTYTTSPGDWTIHDATNRIMDLNNPTGLDFYNDIEVGEFISWHYGWDGKHQLQAVNTDGVTFENLTILNAVNMAIIFGACSDITLTDITMRPSGNQLPVGPRDGIHISRCTGAVNISGLDITGVRWDGLVVRTPYARILNITGANSLTMAVEMNTFSQPIAANSILTFVDSNGQWTDLTVNNAYQYDMQNDESYYAVTLNANLPSFAQTGTNLHIGGLAPSSVNISDSNFENIAGASMILLTNDITVENTSHRKIMFEAIHMGAHAAEGITGDNIQILNSTFDSCGWLGKWGQPAGSIILYNAHNVATEDRLQNAVISNNLFTNQLYDPTIPSIYLAHVNGVTLNGNTFENVYKGMKFDTSTASNYTATNNEIIIDNTDNTTTYSEVSGNFNNSSLQGYNGSNTRYAWWSGAKAEWTFIAPKSSNYDVYIYVVEHANADSNALISVESDSALAQYSVDFTSGGSGWRYLGTYPYTGQVSYTISNQGQSGYLRADAVRFVQQ